MYLKKIELFGFKSFADRTTISFEKGVTAIVGPNGCGKSNISDGIRWVLGEKSAKMLRGGKMEDLLFAGTEFRKPLGFAEVSLTISNEDKLFPIEYEEVVLTRRLYRNGESEYLLNKTPCRLKDIQDLTMDTGIGSNTYSMIEQGEIDYIVQAKADERRFLIEEAAGISKYKSKKEEALRKLERTENNLQRINDIIAEIEKNIKYAERQAKRAESFRLKFDQLKTLELLKAQRDLDSIHKELESLSGEKNTLQMRERELQTHIADFQSRLGRMEQNLREHEEKQQALEEKRFQIKAEISTIQDKCSFNNEKCIELEERNRSLEEQIALSQERIASFQTDLEGRQVELNQFFAGTQTEEESLKARKTNRDLLLAELHSKNEYIHQCQTDVMNITGTVSKKRNEYHKMKNQYTGVVNKKERIEHTLKRLHDEEEEMGTKINDAHTTGETIQSDYTQVQAALQGLTNQKNECEKEYAAIQENLLQKRGIVQEVDSKLKALDEFASTVTFFRKGTQALLDENRQEGSPYYNKILTVSHAIEIREGFEQAIQVALAERLYAVIVDSYTDAIKLVDYVEEHKKGSIDIVVNHLDTGEPGALAETLIKTNEHVLGKGSDFITITDDRYLWIRSLFDTIIVVDELSHIDDSTVKTLTQQCTVVSKKGSVLTKTGLLKWREENEVSAGALRYDERKKKLCEDKKRVEHECAVLSDDAQRVNSVIRDLSSQIDGQSEVVVQRKITIETNEKMNINIQESLAKLQEHKNVLNYEFRESEDELQEYGENVSTLESQLAEMEAELQGKQHVVDTVTKVVREKEKMREEIQVEIASLESTFRAIREKEDYLRNAVDIVTLSCSNEQELNEKNEGELKANKAKVIELREENTDIGTRTSAMKMEAETVETSLKAVKEKRATAARERDNEMTATSHITKEYNEKRDALHAISLKEMELHYQESTIKERIAGTYKINIIEFDFSTLNQDGVNPETLDDDIQALKKRVETLGTVNLLAIEEYNELKDRYSFLIEQRNDLDEAQRSLFEAIRKINRTTKQLFINVFAQVQENFQSYFKILFEGGIAELVLVDEEHPLESGIDIVVRPPGKKTQNVGLLSGGEKALTAVALLFALFKVRPSPFCILDEVDAPLDEANIDRFLKVVFEFLNTTQFIIVTHNRKTIAVADTLFGVTMEEPGISKIVSVRVSDVPTEEGAMEGKGQTHNFNKKTEKVDDTIKEIFREVK